MKDLNHEPDFDPALEHELRKLAPAPVKERLLERMEEAVTHDTAPGATGAATGAASGSQLATLGYARHRRSRHHAHGFASTTIANA